MSFGCWLFHPDQQLLAPFYFWAFISEKHFLLDLPFYYKGRSWKHNIHTQFGSTGAASQLKGALWWDLHRQRAEFVPAGMPHLSLCLSPHLNAATPFTAPTQSKHACSSVSLLGSPLNTHTNGPHVFHAFSHDWKMSVNPTSASCSLRI